MLELIDKRMAGRSEQVLGEFQACFVLFLVGENLEAFEQWKRLFELLTCSPDFFYAHQAFYTKTIRK